MKTTYRSLMQQEPGRHTASTWCLWRRALLIVYRGESTTWKTWQHPRPGSKIAIPTSDAVPRLSVMHPMQPPWAPASEAADKRSARDMAAKSGSVPRAAWTSSVSGMCVPPVPGLGIPAPSDTSMITKSDLAEPCELIRQITRADTN